MEFVSEAELQVLLETAISSPFKEGEVWSGTRRCWTTGVSRIRASASYSRGNANYDKGDILIISRYLDRKDNKEFDPSAWISQAEAARLRGISPQAISELVKRGRLTAYIFGGKKFLKRSEVEAFESRAPGPAPKRRRKN
jgi:excisionase family DNA binding protein